jgi:hypothetical protein
VDVDPVMPRPGAGGSRVGEGSRSKVVVRGGTCGGSELARRGAGGGPRAHVEEAGTWHDGRRRQAGWWAHTGGDREKREKVNP